MPPISSPLAECRSLAAQIWKYGKEKERLIVETESDTLKIKELQLRIAELERIVGQKQIEIDFKDKMIEIAEEHYGIDIKKKCDPSPSVTSGDTGKTTPIH